MIILVDDDHNDYDDFNDYRKRDDDDNDSDDYKQVKEAIPSGFVYICAWPNRTF